MAAGFMSKKGKCIEQSLTASLGLLRRISYELPAGYFKLGFEFVMQEFETEPTMLFRFYAELYEDADPIESKNYDPEEAARKLAVLIADELDAWTEQEYGEHDPKDIARDLRKIENASGTRLPNKLAPSGFVAWYGNRFQA